MVSRREWLTGVGAGGVLAALPGCTDWTHQLGVGEQRLVSHGPHPLSIVQWHRMQPDPQSVLRQRALCARHLPAAWLRGLDTRMRETLARSGGVGLAAPQVGLCRRVILVQLQRPGKPVLTCVDPVLQCADDSVEGYEACLSVQGVGSLVPRSRSVEVTYTDLEGRSQRLSSTGWEARIFQHEVDHLNGVLYLDRRVGPVLPIEEVRRRRRRRHAEQQAPAPVWVAAREGGEGPWVL